MKHIIQREVFEVSTPSLATTQEWEARTSAMLRDLIQPTLESCFDAIAQENQHLIIDRLEIDLGIISEKDYKNTIIDQVRKQVPQIIEKVQREAQPGGQATDLSAKDSGNQLLTKEKAAVNALLHFLQFGTIPWWKTNGGDDWTIEWLEQLSGQYLMAITTCIRNHPNAKKRFNHQFDAPVHARMVERVLGLPTNLGIDLLDFFLQLNKQKEEASILRRVYWQKWIELLSENTTSPKQAVLLLTQWLYTHYAFQPAIQSLRQPSTRKIYEDNQDDSANIKYFLQLIPAELKFENGAAPQLKKLPISDTQQHAQTKEAASSGNGSDGAFPHQDNNKQSTSPFPHQHSESASEHKKEQNNQSLSIGGNKEALLASRETLFVQDAGLIILHPFLKELFSSCGFYNNQSWSTPEAQHAAVHLLGWIARKTQKIPEYELMLHKILCGMPIEEPLDTSISLSTTQLANADELMQAVISHWGVLKSTSVDGLREGFLRRNGKLVPKDDGWKLTVEQKAQDILVGKLPWGLSLIQLPWLDGLRLHIDWQ